jgi:hypothetical protein
MKQTNKISEYILRNAERKNAQWKITAESKMFMHDGMWYDATDFDKVLAMYEYIKFNPKGDNPDKTRIK